MDGFPSVIMETNMATECKQALNELALILATLNVFLSEESEGKWSGWMKTECKAYPNCLAASAKGDNLATDLKDLQKRFNSMVGLKQTFGFKTRGSRAFGQSILVVVPDDVATELEKKQPTGLLASYKDTADTSEMNFG